MYTTNVNFVRKLLILYGYLHPVIFLIVPLEEINGVGHC